MPQVKSRLTRPRACPRSCSARRLLACALRHRACHLRLPPRRMLAPLPKSTPPQQPPCSCPPQQPRDTYDIFASKRCMRARGACVRARARGACSSTHANEVDLCVLLRRRCARARVVCVFARERARVVCVRMRVLFCVFGARAPLHRQCIAKRATTIRTEVASGPSGTEPPYARRVLAADNSTAANATTPALVALLG